MTATVYVWAAAGVLAFCVLPVAVAGAAWQPATQIARASLDSSPLVAFDRRGNAAIALDDGGATVELVRWTDHRFSRPTHVMSGDNHALTPLSLVSPAPGAAVLLIQQIEDPIAGVFCCLDAVLQTPPPHSVVVRHQLTELHIPADGALAAEASGRLIGAFKESPDRSAATAYIRTLAPGATTFGSAQPLQTPGQSPTGTAIGVAADASGGSFVTWLTSASGAVCAGDTVEVAYGHSAGTFDQGQQVASAPVGDCVSGLSVAAAGSGRAAVAWGDDHRLTNGTLGNGQLRVAVGGRTGFRAAQVLTGPRDDAQEAHVSVANDGTVAVAFLACRPSSCSINVAIDDPHGRFGRPQVLARTPATQVGAPVIALSGDGHGDFIVAWNDSNQIAASVRLLSQRRFQRPERLGGAPAGLEAPGLAFGPRGEAIAVFGDGTHTFDPTVRAAVFAIQPHVPG